MSDTVYRQAAIDAMCAACWDWCDEGVCKRVSALQQLPSAQPDIIRCKECKHFHYDMPYVIQGIPVLGHEVCDAWGGGCKTDENGYCFLAEERRADGRFNQ